MPRPKLDRPNYRLRKRGNRYVVDWTEDGKPRSISTGQANERAAEQWRQQFIAGREIVQPPPQPTIAEIMGGYLEDRRGRVEDYERLRFAAKPIKALLGELRPEHLQRRTYWDRRKRSGVASGTIRREGVTLRAALRWAVKEKWLAQAPHIDLPSPPAPRERFLSHDEAAKLIEACKTPHLRLFVLLALNTAARTGAILDLTWDRVDLEAKRIHFRLPGRAETKKRRATVPINKRLLAALQTARDAAVAEHVIEYGGRPIRRIRRAYDGAVKRASIAHCTRHDLRRTAASWMVMAGVPLKKVADMLGDTLAMVERVYGRFSPDYLKEAADALDAVSLTPAKVIRSPVKVSAA